MKVFLDDIKSNAWLVDKIKATSWGSKFLNLKRPSYFVFNYNLLESISGIEIVSSQILFEINEGIYRKWEGSEHIGYMNEPFDTSNYLFFSLLQSALDTQEERDKLKDLFIYYKSVDVQQNKNNLKEIIKGSLDIDSHISFSDALYKIFSINNKPVIGLCMVYELINQYTNYKYGKSIYGNYLTKIVRAVKDPNGGLIPEYSNGVMRYLIIGEKSSPNDENLIYAKKLFREGNYPYTIYLETGWFFNEIDKKWRKRISDDTFLFNLDSFSGEGEEKYFLPRNYDLASFSLMLIELLQQKTSIAKQVALGYDVKLGDIVSFEEAYKYYPELKDIYAVFATNFSGIDGGERAYYFSPSLPYNIVLVNNANTELNKLQYIVLHEIQHYIQEVEGFAQGGNQNLANLIDAVGGSSIKSFFISLSAFQKKFAEVCTLIPLREYSDLIDNLKQIEYENYQIRHKNRMIYVSNYVNSFFKNLSNLTTSSDLIQNSSDSISLYILTLYSMIPQTNRIIEKFVVDNIGADYLELFAESLRQNKKALERDANLINKGWTPNDLYILNFQTYEALGGELEARFVQQTSKIPKELQDYFMFYTSETIDPDRVSVISNSVFNDNTEAEAGIETYDNKYVIHLPSAFSNSINLLHETAHMLYDFEKERIMLDEEILTKAVLSEYGKVEECFCACFVDYIHRKNIEPMLTKDLSKEREIKNLDYFDSLFDEMLFSERKIDESGFTIRLDYINKLYE